MGLEPTTPCLKGRCSNRLSYGPKAQKSTFCVYIKLLSEHLGIICGTHMGPVTLKAKGQINSLHYPYLHGKVNHLVLIKLLIVV